MYHKLNMKRYIQRNSHGFTVVELIVVIVVIGILASVSFLSYSQARNNAIKSKYESNAQQVKLKLSQYFTDNGHYPRLKTDVQTYLTGTNTDSALITEFTKSEYQYTAYTNTAATTTCSTAAACQYYRITINKANWNGGSADSNIVVSP